VAWPKALAPLDLSGGRGEIVRIRDAKGADKPAILNLFPAFPDRAARSCVSQSLDRLNGKFRGPLHSLSEGKPEGARGKRPPFGVAAQCGETRQDSNCKEYPC
jgi:hypothetical protein